MLPIIPPRLHPESWRTLRQLVALHGADALIATIRTITAERSEIGLFAAPLPKAADHE